MKKLLKLLETVIEGSERNSLCHTFLNSRHICKVYGETKINLSNPFDVVCGLCSLMVDPYNSFLSFADQFDTITNIIFILTASYTFTLIHIAWVSIFSLICRKTLCVTPLHLTQCVTVIAFDWLRWATLLEQRQQEVLLPVSFTVHTCRHVMFLSTVVV